MAKKSKVGSAPKGPKLVWYTATMRIQGPEGMDPELLAEEIIARIDHFSVAKKHAEHPSIDLNNCMTPDITCEGP